MKPVRAGDLRVISLQQARKHCFAVAFAAFLAGGSLGIYAGHAAWADRHDPIKAALVQIGNYLCRQYEGLKEIWRVGPKDYGFSCHGIAVFPKVEITLKEKP